MEEVVEFGVALIDGVKRVVHRVQGPWSTFDDIQVDERCVEPAYLIVPGVADGTVDARFHGGQVFVKTHNDPNILAVDNGEAEKLCWMVMKAAKAGRNSNKPCGGNG